MVFLLQCPRLPLNIHHWTLHGKLWPLAFTQTPSHSASGVLIKQTTHCCLHSDPLSLHIKTHSLPPPQALILLFSLSLSPPAPLAPIDRLPISSPICTSFGALASLLLLLSPLCFICVFVPCDEGDLGGYCSWGGWKRKRGGMNKKEKERQEGGDGWEDGSCEYAVLRGPKWKPWVFFQRSASKMDLLYSSTVITLPLLSLSLIYGHIYTQCFF